MSQRRIWIFAASLAIVGVAGITALTSPGRPTQAEEVKVADDLPTPHELLAALPGELTPRIPLDVNRDLQKKLVDQKKFAEEQLLFDLLSWRTFVALNWPVDAAGNPQPKITDPSRKFWDTWKTDLDTFLPDGAKPAPWGSNHLNHYMAAHGISATPMRSSCTTTGTRSRSSATTPTAATTATPTTPGSFSDEGAVHRTPEALALA